MSIKYTNRILKRFNITVEITEFKLILLLSVLGLLILYLGSLLILQDIAIEIKAISSALLSIGGSIVAAAIIGCALMIYDNISKHVNLKSLKMLLDINDIENSLDNDKIAIVIPRFKHIQCNNCPHELNSDSVDDELPSHTVKDRRLTNKYSHAFDDIVAVRHITSIFTEAGLKPPRIEFDDDVYKSVFKTKTPIHSAYILVGLYSNYMTMEFSDRIEENDKRCFVISKSNKLYSGKRCISICPEAETPINWLREFSFTNWDKDLSIKIDELPEINERQEDFGLIAKCKSPHGQACLIIAGAKSRGTRKTASYFRKNINNIVNIRNDTGTKVLANNCFAMLYKINGKKDSTPKRGPIKIS